MEHSENPIVDMLNAGMQSAPTTVNDTQEAPVETQQDNQQAADEVNLSENNNTDSSTQLEASDTELETINDSNSADADNLPSEEVASEANTNETGDEKPWWDDDKKTEGTESSDIDFSTVSKAIGIEGNSLEDITTAYSSLQAEVSEYKEKIEKIDSSSPYANEDIAKMNEIAQNGGDYKNYMGIGQVDYDAVSDVDFLHAKLQNALGDDAEGIQGYIDGMSPAEVKVKASEIRNEYKAQQSAQLQQIQQDAADKRAKTDAGIRASLDKTTEMFGVKLTPGAKKELYNEVTTDKFMNSIFRKEDGSVNHEGITKAAFLIKNINQIMKTNMTKDINRGRGEILSEASNPKIRNNGEYASPKEKKETTALGGFMEGLKTGGPY